ncbi:MAG: LamG domain-containing protein, partial [Candidatus Omnitrophica bacterium]|nr:LamG domain-containing protein [Candidatus Omnitrophota bacterium]
MKKIFFILIILLLFSSSAQAVIQRSPFVITFDGGLNNYLDDLFIKNNQASYIRNGQFEKGYLSVRDGCNLIYTFSKPTVTNFIYTTEADFANGETKTVDYTTYPGTICLASTVDSWVQGSVSDFNAAESLVNIDSTTILGQLTIYSVDRASSNTGAAIATLTESYSFSNTSAMAIDRDTKTIILPRYADLVSAWQFEETTGAVNDQTSKNNGELVNGVICDTTGIINKCFYFDGVNDYINVGDNVSLQPSGEITIACWVNPTTISLTDAHIIFGDYGASLGPRLSIGMTVNAKFDFGIAIDGTNRVVTSAATAVAGTWYFLVGTYNGTTVTLYVNGVSVGTPITDVGVITDYAGNWNIGRENDNVRFFGGHIDEPMFWNKALSASEILTLYQSGSPQADTYTIQPSSWASASMPFPRYLTIELNETTTIGGAAWYTSFETKAPNSFDIQYKDATTGLWDTAVAVINLADTKTWSETFTGVNAKIFRLCIYDSDTPTYIREFYLLPQATYISQWNTDALVTSGLISNLTVSDTLNNGYIDYYYRTNNYTGSESDWIQITKNTTLNQVLLPCFQVKTVLTPKFMGIANLYAPIFETFTLNYQYRTSATGQWVSDKIDRGTSTYLLLKKFSFTFSDSNTTGTSIVYYVRHANSSVGVDSAIWVYAPNDSITYTANEWVQLRADLLSASTLFTPYLYNLGIISEDSNASGEIRGMGTHYTKSGTKYMWAVCDTNVLYSSDLTDWTIVRTGVTNDANVEGVVFADTNWMTDGTTVWSIAADGTTVNEYSSDTIPPFKYLETFQNRLCGFNTADHPSRFYYSASSLPDSFPAGNYIDVQPEDGDQGTSMRQWRGNLYLGKKYSKWYISGVTPVPGYSYTWNLENISTAIGSLSQRSALVSENSIVTPALWGIYGTGYIFDSKYGLKDTLLSQNIEDDYLNARQV